MMPLSSELRHAVALASGARQLVVQDPLEIIDQSLHSRVISHRKTTVAINRFLPGADKTHGLRPLIQMHLAPAGRR